MGKSFSCPSSSGHTPNGAAFTEPSWIFGEPLGRQVIRSDPTGCFAIDVSLQNKKDVRQLDHGGNAVAEWHAGPHFGTPEDCVANSDTWHDELRRQNYVTAE